MQLTIPDELLDRVAEKFRMLADPMRLSILRTLMVGENNVGTVVSETGQNQANVSKDIKMLTEGGSVRRRKAGFQVFYCLDDPLVHNLCALVCGAVLEGA